MKENKVVDHGKYAGKMLTLEEAAKYLRMGKSTLYECINNSLIDCHRPPRGKILFNIEVLDAWLDKSEVPAGTAKV